MEIGKIGTGGTKLELKYKLLFSAGLFIVKGVAVTYEVGKDLVSEYIAPSEDRPSVTIGVYGLWSMVGQELKGIYLEVLVLKLLTVSRLGVNHASWINCLCASHCRCKQCSLSDWGESPCIPVHQGRTLITFVEEEKH